jgi:hypothetical protein
MATTTGGCARPAHAPCSSSQRGSPPGGHPGRQAGEPGCRRLRGRLHLDLLARPDISAVLLQFPQHAHGEHSRGSGQPSRSSRFEPTYLFRYPQFRCRFARARRACSSTPLVLSLNLAICGLTWLLAAMASALVPLYASRSKRGGRAGAAVGQVEGGRGECTGLEPLKFFEAGAVDEMAPAAREGLAKLDPSAIADELDAATAGPEIQFRHADWAASGRRLSDGHHAGGRPCRDLPPPVAIRPGRRRFRRPAAVGLARGLREVAVPLPPGHPNCSTSPTTGSAGSKSSADSPTSTRRRLTASALYGKRRWPTQIIFPSPTGSRLVSWSYLTGMNVPSFQGKGVGRKLGTVHRLVKTPDRKDAQVKKIRPS